MPKHEEQSPSRRDFLIQMFEDVYNVYNGFKPLHSSSNSEPLRKAILRARTVVHGFDDMPIHRKEVRFWGYGERMAEKTICEGDRPA